MSICVLHGTPRGIYCPACAKAQEEAFDRKHAEITSPETAPDWLRKKLQESLETRRTKIFLALCRELPANQADLLLNLASRQLETT